MLEDAQFSPLSVTYVHEILWKNQQLSHLCCYLLSEKEVACKNKMKSILFFVVSSFLCSACSSCYLCCTNMGSDMLANGDNEKLDYILNYSKEFVDN